MAGTRGDRAALSMSVNNQSRKGGLGHWMVQLHKGGSRLQQGQEIKHIQAFDREPQMDVRGP